MNQVAASLQNRDISYIEFCSLLGLDIIYLATEHCFDMMIENIIRVGSSLSNSEYYCSEFMGSLDKNTTLLFWALGYTCTSYF